MNEIKYEKQSRTLLKFSESIFLLTVISLLVKSITIKDLSFGDVVAGHIVVGIGALIFVFYYWLLDDGLYHRVNKKVNPPEEEVSK